VERQAASGAWPVGEGLPAGIMPTAVTILALAEEIPLRPVVEKAVAWLVGVEGRRPGAIMVALQRLLTRQREDVRMWKDRGWPWVEGTANWVEPTSFAILALRAGAPGSAATGGRVAAGEALLEARACVGGGWNYGNARILGADLRPHADTTAIALLALAGSARSHAARPGLAALLRLMEEARSGLALSLGILALRAWGEPVAAYPALLEDAYRRRGFLGQTRVFALAALALDPEGALTQGTTHG
jgi:hypothetical protein